ncbi:hypothetical protein FJ872_03530 [Mesorhizobium sp. B2-5-9]|uniref:hypothetical protein n=1 Tax=unclassified Mesorhizobium TaxID=325217 RepID=UPI00112BBFBB|nr:MULTISPECIES: hypothetical protein [unclassified Mesorhizobium]TPK23415.1 hypothetical protein FJ872_03530 [Mesorhizobium sp. B2-5-9]TPK83847.1 hypothetical protein FJ936_18865 [Mesorhizobium sp. B2-4-13]
MAKIIVGLSYQKGRIRHTTISENGERFQYVAHGSIKYDPDLPLGELVERWRLDFDELLKAQKPVIVGATEILESGSRNSARYQILPLGLTALSCQKCDVPLKVFSPQAFIKGGPFGLAQGVRPISQVDSQFGSHSPNWDDMQRKSALAAWRAGLD